MNQNNKSYLLYSEEAKTYTSLNRFNTRKNNFEGEYSLLHNQTTEDAFFLSKFLVSHQEQPLFLLPSGNDKYTEVLTDYDRFLENDISKYMEEKLQKEEDGKRILHTERSLGQLQLVIVKKMIEEQLKSVRSQEVNTPADHQVVLGKELSLQWALHMIQDVIEKGN